MTVDEAFAKIQALQVNALTRAAEVALATVKPMIPISRGVGRSDAKPGGTLRNTTGIDAGKESVDLVSGARGTGAESYVHYQYAKAERHLSDGQVLRPMVDVMPPDIKKSVKGKTYGQKYGRAYRYAVQMNLLSTFPGGVRWFRILLTDQNAQRKMASVYARAL